MSLSTNKILVASTYTNTAAAYPETITITSVGIGNATAMNAGVSSAQYIPAGFFTLLPTANITIEFNTYTANANSWTTLFAASTGATFYSDGFNWRANASTGTQTLTLYGVNDGQAATGQYNNK
jgi:hypothetical protein